MKYCVCIRGAHYPFHNSIIDYKKSFNNYNKVLFQPIRDEDHEIHIFLLTYDSKVLAQLIEDYNPTAKYILPESEINAMCSWDRQKHWHLQSGIMIEQYEKEQCMNFDFIINTRFDLEFTPLVLPNINYEKINIVYKHTPTGNCDDNFFCFPRNYLSIFTNAMSKLNITHEICQHIDSDNISYICPMSTTGWADREYEQYMRIARLSK
jgi:hypothetical protein